MSEIKKPKKSLTNRKIRHVAKKIKWTIKKRIRKMKKGTKIFLMVIISLLLIFGTYKLVDTIVFETKNDFSVEDVESAVNKIYRNNMGFDSDIYLFYWNEKRDGGDLFFKNVNPSLLNSNNFYICTDGGSSWMVRHFKPTEITATFECLLYFRGKKLPGEFIGIMNYQNTGAQLHPNNNTTFITNDEFEQLCSEVDITGLSRRKAAKKLAEVWIDYYDYVKR